MSGEFAGRPVLVTGASKGIGAGIAAAFGEAGAHVALAYGRDRDAAERLATRIEAAGGRALPIACDLADPAAIEALVASAARAFGPLQVLVNSAGVFDYQPLERITAPHFHAQFTVNVLGLLTATRHAVASFPEAGGSVVNISSLAALGRAPGRAVYTATKAAVNAITHVLALELAPRGIRVNAIMPGYVDTEGARATGLAGTPAESRLLDATPLGRRPGLPADVAPAALFLASRAAAWITGEILTVSGGLR